MQHILRPSTAETVLRMKCVSCKWWFMRSVCMGLPKINIPRVMRMRVSAHYSTPNTGRIFLSRQISTTLAKWTDTARKTDTTEWIVMCGRRTCATAPIHNHRLRIYHSECVFNVLRSTLFKCTHTHTHTEPTSRANCMQILHMWTVDSDSVGQHNRNMASAVVYLHAETIFQYSREMKICFKIHTFLVWLLSSEMETPKNAWCPKPAHTVVLTLYFCSEKNSNNLVVHV